MQITPNDVGASKGLLNSLDPKVLQLINTFVNKVLPIEKLVLNQSQGVLLKLAFENKQLNLQMPLKTASLFKNISQNSVKLSLSINNQQQVQIQLYQANSNGLTTKPVLFQTAKLLPEQILQLSNPKQYAAVLQKAPSASSSSADTRDSNQLNLKQPSSENSLHKPQLQQNQRSNDPNLTRPTSSSKDIKISISDSKISASLSNVSSGSLKRSETLSSVTTARSATTKQTNANQISVADAAKQLLKSHFSKQLPVAKHLSNIGKLANILYKQSPSIPLQVKLQKQIGELLAVIQKPVKHSAGEIKQRIENSGHLLEKNLSRQIVQVEAAANQPIKPNSQREMAKGYIKTDLSIKPKEGESPKVDQQTTFTKSSDKILTPTSQSNDMKLQLMKIRSTLETIINQAKQPLNDQVKSSSPTATVSTASEPKLMTTQQQPASATDRPVIQAKAQFFIQQQLIVKQATELLTEVRNVVSQIESNQLLSLKNDVPNLHQFLVDLPFKNNSNIDSFEMLFEKSDTDKDGRKVKHWKVVVRFDLEPLGPMFAQVELENERISTHFFAQSENTAQLINQHLHLLKKSLFNAGVDVEKLEGSQGKIPQRLLKDNEQLIDTHA